MLLLTMSAWHLPKYFNVLKKVFSKIDRFFTANWRLAVLDLDRGRWFVPTNYLSIPYLKAENAKGRHILIQPNKTVEPFYMLADDLTWELIQKQHMTVARSYRPGRMIIETSPGNYQVWIRSKRKLTIDEKKFWLKKMKSDPSASPKNRWGRCPGFRNRKEKYRAPEHFFPLARLIWVDYVNQATIPVVENDIKKANIRKSPKDSYYSSSLHSIYRKNYEKGNDSVTDFSFALALARTGASSEYIEYRIRSEREDWKNHIGEKRTEAYLRTTIQKVMSIVAKP